jgi:glycosyltransferase involved in cell wall biosynthesis
MDIGTRALSRIVAAVDLLPLRPGGENGGIKPAIFALLRSLRREAADRLFFIFLTNSSSHSQVRELAGPNDILVCVLEEPQHPFEERRDNSNEYKLAPAPADLIRSLEADLLYCPFGATTFHVAGLPTIALVADFLHRDYPFTLTKEQIAERETYIQKTVRDATLLQCISRSGMERAAAHYQIPASRLFYTYLPIHERLGQARLGVTESTTSLPERPFFFYPANLWLHKNHEVLLVSYSRYRHLANNEPWDLVLTFHEEPRAAYLRSLAATLGCSNGVHFLGFLSEPELHGVWLRAGALIFPSQHEGFGIPLLEAMHYGVPIVTGARFSLKEVAGDACYLVDPRKPIQLSEALLAVSQDKLFREKLIKKGRERLALFDDGVSARTLFDVFCSLTRKEHDFPRRPRYSDESPIISMPTPASGARWEIEIQYRSAASARKCSVYLDDKPFAYFVTDSRAEGRFSFVCRPEGRTLALRLAPINHEEREGLNGGENFVTKIVASQCNGGRLLLYESDHPLSHT